MSNKLREDITAYMRKQSMSSGGWFCTWWYRHHIDHGALGTRAIRKELERMEKAGLVRSDHSQMNNTKWQLTEVTP